MSLFFDRLDELGRTRAAHPAICDDRRCVTYAELAEQVKDAACRLVALGVGQGTRVGVSISDELDHLVATLALLRVGAWQLTLATHDTDGVRAELAERILATHVVGRDAPAPTGLPSIGWPLPITSDAPSSPDDGGILFRTSGTTGTSNLVPFAADDIALQAQHNPEYAGGRHLRLASVEHNNSKRHRLYCLYMGATNVLKPAEPFDLAHYATAQGVTCIDMSIMHAVSLADAVVAPDLRGIDIRVGGSSTPHHVRKRLEARVSDRLFIRYGSTESGTIAICPPGAHDTDDPVGRPVEGLAVEIVDNEGGPLVTGEAGNIRLRGAGVATRYHEDPEQTAKRFRDGWFWPGDIGRFRPDGMLVVMGRVDEMIILNSINIFPSEIERILELHPAVATAAATGLASGAHGQIPVAAVELHSGSNTDERTLLGFARERLGLRAPRKIKIVQALPRSPQGKLLRRALPPLFAASGNTEGSKV